MAIVSNPVAALSPRDHAIMDIGFIIDEAASSPESVDPYALASTIMAAVEKRRKACWDSTVVNSPLCEVIMEYAAKHEEFDVDYFGDSAFWTVKEAVEATWTTPV